MGDVGCKGGGAIDFASFSRYISITLVVYHCPTEPNCLKFDIHYTDFFYNSFWLTKVILVIPLLTRFTRKIRLNKKLKIFNGKI